MEHRPGHALTAASRRATLPMSTPRALADLDLAPRPGRSYFPTEREWREEFAALVRASLAPTSSVLA